jgi:hypothetical protein
MNDNDNSDGVLEIRRFFSFAFGKAFDLDGLFYKSISSLRTDLYDMEFKVALEMLAFICHFFNARTNRHLGIEFVIHTNTSHVRRNFVILILLNY